MRTTTSVSCKSLIRAEDFAQALRSIGEPIFGRQVRDISMARLLAQLFEVTRLFDMHLQPQLVLLQKTMVVVEGVAREIDPDLDIWAAARPVVETWMMRELGPEARIQEAAETAVSLARVAMRAPDVLTKMEAAAGRLSALSQDGLRLHPESAPGDCRGGSAPQPQLALDPVGGNHRTGRPGGDSRRLRALRPRGEALVEP